MPEIEYLVQNKMNKIKISITLNIILFVLMVFALYMALSGLSFDMTFKKHSIHIFKYFTVLSNILMGIVALVFAIREILYLKNNKEISKYFYVAKHIATTCVALTFLTVALFLAPVFYKEKFFDAFHDANFFYHFLNPVLAIIVFVFFENTNKLSIKTALFGMVPFGVYSIFYLITAITHMSGGKVDTKYDWYGFFYFGVPIFFVLMIFMISLTFLISFILYKSNKKLYKNSN